LKRGSASQCSSPIILAHRRNIGSPITVATIQPSRVRKMSAGPELNPRLTIAVRLTPVSACSIRVALVKGDGGAQQRAFDLLAAPGLAALDQRRQGAERRKTGGAEIDPRHLDRDRLLGGAREVHRAAHRLADAVEAVLVRQRPAGAESRHRRQDDVGLGLAQIVEVEGQRPQHAGRQVGDDDIGGRHQLFDDLPALGCSWVERHPELVAVHRQEHRTTHVCPGADRDHAAVFAATDALDADHLRTEIAEERRAERPRDVTPEIENPNAFEHASQHDLPPHAGSTDLNGHLMGGDILRPARLRVVAVISRHRTLCSLTRVLVEGSLRSSRQVG
jgi:hypothetical protein